MDAPIFVVGAPRSGTTLTGRILGRHSRIFMPGETHFFLDIYSRRQEFGRLDDGAVRDKVIESLSTLYGRYNEVPDQARVDRLFSVPGTVARLKASFDTYADVLRCFMELQMQAEGKGRWGNQAPKDIFHVPDILSFFPNAKIVVCVRDVRDFLVSYKHKWRVTSREHVGRLKQLYHPVLTSLLWKSSARLIPRLESYVPKENLILVRYEELVTQPERVVRAICLCIGEEFETSMLEVTVNNSSRTTENAGIFSSSVGRWASALEKNEMEREEIALAQLIAGRELRSLGYETESLPSRKLTMMKWLLTTPAAVWRALNANKERQVPMVPYLLRRLSALLYRR